MGSAFDHRPYERHPKLGNGVQEVPPRLQSPQLLRQPKTQKRASKRVERQVSLQCLHNLVCARPQGRGNLEEEAMVLHDLGRGSYDQKLQEPAMDDASGDKKFQEVTLDGDTVTE